MKLDQEPTAQPLVDLALPADSNGPLVTVILPVYGRDQFLDQSIQSVLGQTHPRIQLIVVDDGSPVDPLPCVARFGEAIEFYRKPNGGPASARNFGLSRARGEFLLFLDDDDYLEAHAVQALLKPLDGRADLAWSAGRLAYMDEQGQPLPVLHPCRIQSGDVYAAMIRDNLIGTPSAALLRTHVVRSLGGFDENPRYRLCEDYDLWLELARDYPLVAIPEVVSNYRYHAGNATLQWAQHYPAWLAVLEKNRQKARTGFAAVFQQAIARVHLNFGDELYVHGRHTEARLQWTKQCATDPGQGRLLPRYAKSYCPPWLLDTLRGVQNRLFGCGGGRTLGNDGSGDLTARVRDGRLTTKSQSMVER